MENIMRRLNELLDSAFGGVLRLFERLPTFAFIALVFAGSYLSFSPNPNEDHYLQFSKQFMNPDWVPNSQILTEFPGTRLLYQCIMGSLLQVFSFDLLVFAMRLLMILVFSLILSKLYKRLNFSNLQVAFHLVVLYLGCQSLFAGAWMFVSVEPKGIAYIFVLLSILQLLNDRLLPAVLLMIVATYFHILVGFFTFIYLWATLFFFHKSQKVSIKTLFLWAGLFLLAAAPLVLYLKTSIAPPDSGLQPRPDWIYTYFRAPHHTALATSMRYFYREHFYGVLLSGFGLILAIRLLRQQQPKDLLFLNQFVVLSLAGAIALVSVAFIDKEGVLLKYYLYRIMALSTFFLTLLIAKWLWHFIRNDAHKLLNELVLLLSILFFLKLLLPNLLTNKEYFFDSADFNSACQFIRDHTSQDALVFTFVEDVSITRRTERDRFVVYKFIPAKLDRIHDWYDRILEKEKVLEDTQYLDTLVQKYQLTHILTDHQTPLPAPYSVQFENKKYKVYAVN
ncbi:MAG: DUF6798 domain-containing protein [Bacteroidota bacterium]